MTSYALLVTYYALNSPYKLIDDLSLFNFEKAIDYKKTNCTKMTNLVIKDDLTQSLNQNYVTIFNERYYIYYYV